MFDRVKYLAACKAQGLRQEDISAALKINDSTLYRKTTGKSDFSRAEIQTLRVLLSLSIEGADAIFFAEESA